jgi:hypothetical protein
MTPRAREVGFWPQAGFIPPRPAARLTESAPAAIFPANSLGPSKRPAIKVDGDALLLL